MSIRFVADRQALLAKSILVSPAGSLPNFALLLFETKPESQTVSEEETGNLRDIRAIGPLPTSILVIDMEFGYKVDLDVYPHLELEILFWIIHQKGENPSYWLFRRLLRCKHIPRGSGLGLLYTLNNNAKIIAFLQKITASVPQKGLISYI